MKFFILTEANGEYSGLSSNTRSIGLSFIESNYDDCLTILWFIKEGPGNLNAGD